VISSPTPASTQSAALNRGLGRGARRDDARGGPRESGLRLRQRAGSVASSAPKTTRRRQPDERLDAERAPSSMSTSRATSSARTSVANCVKKAEP
jgi:hypothetical protein